MVCNNGQIVNLVNLVKFMTCYNTNGTIGYYVLELMQNYHYVFQHGHISSIFLVYLYASVKFVSTTESLDFLKIGVTCFEIVCLLMNSKLIHMIMLGPIVVIYKLNMIVAPNFEYETRVGTIELINQKPIETVEIIECNFLAEPSKESTLDNFIRRNDSGKKKIVILSYSFTITTSELVVFFGPFKKTQMEQLQATQVWFELRILVETAVTVIEIGIALVGGVVIGIALVGGAREKGEGHTWSLYLEQEHRQGKKNSDGSGPKAKAKTKSKEAPEDAKKISVVLASIEKKPDKSKKGSSISSASTSKSKAALKVSSYVDGLDLPPSDEEDNDYNASKEERQESDVLKQPIRHKKTE
ncbi:hypothetical protein POM88_028501 [Heracleum sosnowskyi]|uniref:Uncharacterized protein n=1 Tax=Heracleum sosnowskyi TaxID=360622 RepID=A0AAD8HT00_9APIA|nr:hypothetical protein POM88_028501 [Heracleum sosnowskyi]